MNPGPDEQSRGNEYPSLEKSPTPADAFAPVDYPSDPATTPDYQQPPYPAPGYQQPSYQQQPGYEQPGYPPPAYPQHGYPPPPAGYPPPYQGGYAYGYDPYAQGRPVGTNGKAIAALVTSLVGLTFCGLPSIAGLILGIIAMRETKRTGQDGHGLALAGVIVGALATLFFIVLIVVYVISIAVVVSNPTTNF